MKKHFFTSILLLAACLSILTSYKPIPVKKGLVPLKNGQFTIYARLDFDNTTIYTSTGPNGCPFTEEYSTVTLRFFSDDIGTIPVSVTNLPVSIHHFYNFNAWVSTSDYNLTCNGTSVGIDNAMLSFYDDGCDGNYSAESYSLNSSAAYTIIY